MQKDAIHMNMRAAFNKVIDKVLSNKLRKAGFIGNALRLIEPFLTKRVLIVKMKNHKSQAFEALTGVP